MMMVRTNEKIKPVRRLQLQTMPIIHADSEDKVHRPLQSFKLIVIDV